MQRSRSNSKSDCGRRLIKRGWMLCTGRREEVCEQVTSVGFV